MKVYLTTSRWALLCVASSTAFSPAPSLILLRSESRSRRCSSSISKFASPWDDVLIPLAEDDATNNAVKTFTTTTSPLITAEDVSALGSSIMNNAPLLLVPAVSFAVGQAVLKSREAIQKNVVRTELLLNRLKNGSNQKNSANEVEITERDLTKLKSQLKSADSLITASFTGASVSSAVSLCVLLGAVDVPQFAMPSLGGDYNPLTLLAGQPPLQPKVLTIESPKQAAMVEDASPYNDALLSSSTSAKESEPTAAMAMEYDVVVLPTESSNNEPQRQQESAMAVVPKVEIPNGENNPSFIDALMSKVDSVSEKSAEVEAASVISDATKPSFVDTLMSKLETETDDTNQKPEKSSNVDALLSSKTTEDPVAAAELNVDTSTGTMNQLVAKTANPETPTDAASLDIGKPEGELSTSPIQSSPSEQQQQQQQLLASTTNSPDSVEAIGDNQKAELLDEPLYEIIPQEQKEDEKQQQQRMTASTTEGADVDSSNDGKEIATPEPVDDSKLLASPTVEELTPIPKMTLLEKYGADLVLL